VPEQAKNRKTLAERKRHETALAGSSEGPGKTQVNSPHKRMLAQQAVAENHKDAKVVARKLTQVAETSRAGVALKGTFGGQPGRGHITAEIRFSEELQGRDGN